MSALDGTHLAELLQTVNNISHDNIGDSMVRAVVIRSAMGPVAKAETNAILSRIRDFSRKADIGWKIFEKPVMPNSSLTDTQIWQLIGIVGTLSELNFCFEKVEEASFFTFENSAPVRFYVNGIFHYLAALFLLDIKGNKKSNLPRPGTVIKALHPIGLEKLLDPIYQVFDCPFGAELNYGRTVLSIRNKQFVHGSFSPENIQRIVKDSSIFDQTQRIRFMENHWDLYDRLIILRLQLMSIITLQNIDLDDFSPSKIYHF